MAKKKTSQPKKEAVKKTKKPTEEREEIFEEVEKEEEEKEEEDIKSNRKKDEKKEPEETDDTAPGKTKVLPIVLVIIFFLAVGLIGWYVVKKQREAFSQNDGVTPTVNEQITPPVGEQKTYRVVDGVEPSNGTVNPLPFAVMVENLSVVRPQSGLSFAPVVYETLAEGGITRFMAIFTDEKVEKIGPVRSARPYYLEWSSEYDAIYCHAGGSPDALEAISGLKIDSLNAISGEGKYFYRDSGRAAPHNLFTDTDLLSIAIRDKSLESKVVDYQGWKFKDEAPLADRPATGVGVKIHFSTDTYASGYTYNRETNRYLRENGGYAHKDALTGGQIEVKNVVIQRVPPEIPAGEKGRIFLDVTGQGEVVILRDGQKIVGTWKKANREDRTRFFDANGQEILLNRGNTWVHVVPTDKLVEFIE